jgi:hypothetical protein
MKIQSLIANIKKLFFFIYVLRSDIKLCFICLLYLTSRNNLNVKHSNAGRCNKDCGAPNLGTQGCKGWLFLPIQFLTLMLYILLLLVLQCIQGDPIICTEYRPIYPGWCSYLFIEINIFNKRSIYKGNDRKQSNDIPKKKQNYLHGGRRL